MGERNRAICSLQMMARSGAKLCLEAWEVSENMPYSASQVSSMTRLRLHYTESQPMYFGRTRLPLKEIVLRSAECKRG